jgi:hypothetical protein
MGSNIPTMHFTQSNKNDLLVLLNIVTMGDCFHAASLAQEERSKTWLNVTIKWVALLPSLFHLGNPHVVFLDHKIKYQLFYFAAVHAALNKTDKSFVVASFFDQDFNINPMVLDFNINPMVLDFNFFKVCFLGVSTKEEAIKYNLPYSKSLFFEACDFPKEGSPALTWFRKNGFPNLYLAKESMFPVVAAFPKVLVTQTGSIVPIDVPATTDGINQAIANFPFQNTRWCGTKLWHSLPPT